MAPLPLFSPVPLRQRYANMPRLSRAPDGGPGSSVRAPAACAGGTAAGAWLLPPDRPGLRGAAPADRRPARRPAPMIGAWSASLRE